MKDGASKVTGELRSILFAQSIGSFVGSRSENGSQVVSRVNKESSSVSMNITVIKFIYEI